MKRTFHGANALEITSPSMRFCIRTEFDFNEKAPSSDKKYTGPQKAQELMKALDADYNKGHAKTEVSLSLDCGFKFVCEHEGYAKTEVSVSRKRDGIETESYSSNLTISEIDARYPRAEWLQLLLERGIIIGNLYEYASTLSQRYALVSLEDNPNLWQSGALDIPPTDDWETYKTAYINKLVEIEATKAEIERTKAEIERTKAEIDGKICFYSES